MSTDITYWSITEEKPMKNHHESAYSPDLVCFRNLLLAYLFSYSDKSYYITSLNAYFLILLRFF